MYDQTNNEASELIKAIAFETTLSSEEAAKALQRYDGDADIFWRAHREWVINGVWLPSYAFG